MGLYDRFADRKPQSHVSGAVAPHIRRDFSRPVECILQFLRRESPSVIRNPEPEHSLSFFHGDADPADISPVNRRIFHEVDQHPLNQQRFHGNERQIIFQGCLHIHARIMPVEFLYRFEDHFLRIPGLNAHFRLSGAHPGDRQKILYHPDEPLGFVPHVPEQLLFLRLCEILIFQNRRCGAVDGSQRRPDVMGDRSQQVRLHLHPFVLQFQHVPLLQLGCQRAGDDGHAQQNDKGERVAGRREIKCVIRIGEHEVHHENPQNGGSQTVHISFRKPGNHQHGQNEYRRGIPLGDLVNPKNIAQQHSCQDDQHRDAGIQGNLPAPPALLLFHILYSALLLRRLFILLLSQNLLTVR